MDLGLKDRVALVAASSQGLGKAVALGLAREGAKLALCARTDAVLQKTAAEIRNETGAEALAQAVDVMVREQATPFIRVATHQFGCFDICISNSGGPPSKSFVYTPAG